MNTVHKKPKKAACKLPYKRIVIKLGTKLVTGGGSHLDTAVINELVRQMAELHRQGVEIVLVSSGAIASGRQKLGLQKKVRGIPYKQVLAAVGQSRLMDTYEGMFGQHDITIAQALLTKHDLANRHGYLNARNTLLALMELDVICIVNENDIVSVDEIKEAKFGDNDNLSAMVANLIDADLLMILTDIAGLYDCDPAKNANAMLIPLVEKINAGIKKMGATTTSKVGTGGMITKIEAAALATASGIEVIIADGREPDVVIRLAGGESIGTRFLPVNGELESRERWMLSGLSTRGRLVVDEGAARALKNNKKSLLAAGITRVEGKFNRGDIVTVCDSDETQLGCGISNYSSADIGVIKGSHSDKMAGLLEVYYGPEVVHRNNFTLMEREDTSGQR